MAATTSTPCIFFQRGRCRNGDACRFSHASSDRASSDLHSRPDPRAQVLCKFHVQGICKQGAKCSYRHEQLDSSSDSTDLTQVQQQADNDTFVRFFHGALVRFGDGACVTSLLLTLESSSVRLDGLPANITPADVISMLEGLGHDVEVDGLRVIPMPQPSPLCSAYISTPDLEFAKTLSTSLIDTPYHDLKAVPVPPRLPTWASTRRARCNRLQLRWTSPRGVCCLYFPSERVAQRVREKFHSGRYTVGSRRTECAEPVVIRNAQMCSVQASGLPYRCTEEMIRASFTDHWDAPLQITMPRRTAWQRKTVEAIKEFLNGIGPMTCTSVPYKHKGQYWTLSAQFEQDSDAQIAARAIEERFYNLPYDVHLTARLVYTSTFKTSNQVFQHVEKRLQDDPEALNAPRLKVTQRSDSTILSLDSCNPEELARCANTVEAVVAGLVIQEKEGYPFWVAELASNGSASKELKEIQQQHGILLLPNKSRREIRYFGADSKHQAVQDDVIQRLTSVVKSRLCIDLDDVGFASLCKVGLGQLKTLIGKDVLSLIITSNPKKLIITGSEEDHCKALELLELFDIVLPVKETKSKEEENCSVCLTPAENPVFLGCRHTYCAECFKGLCLKSNAQADICAACVGEGDKCKNAIPLKEIQDNVDSSTFEQLLESSFNTYITRRIDQFRYCPTPDCGYLYRVTSRGDSSDHSMASSIWHMCPRCLKRICRSCHANHEGRSCDEYQEYQSNAAFEAYKNKNSARIKDCPNCGTTIEKTAGCNHIECGGCHTHICWQCMKTFKASQETYDHMHKAHNTIGI